jgi:hypothetical protein
VGRGDRRAGDVHLGQAGARRATSSPSATSISIGPVARPPRRSRWHRARRDLTAAELAHQAHLDGGPVPPPGSFRRRMVSDQGLYQLFVHDPNGIKIELNFANAEAIASGIEPELTASELPD